MWKEMRWTHFVVYALISSKVFPEKDNGNCNEALGLSSGLIPDDAIRSEVGNGSSSCRLSNPNDAWCFEGATVISHEAIITFDLTKPNFVSGLASQGPPLALHAKAYHHLVAFVVSHSLDAKKWTDFNGENLMFTSDKNDTSDLINYHVFDTIVLTRYVRVNVTLQLSGIGTSCLRLEIYGCGLDVSPSAGIDATTTTKGQIFVSWSQPQAVNTIDPAAESSSVGRFSPNNYVVSYRPIGGGTSLVSTTATQVLLSDVRLGATYDLELQCHISSVILQCGLATIEAYPPCPGQWSRGNEYHCFLFLEETPNFPEARSRCIEGDDSINQQLGPLGSLVNADEERFLTSRILPSSIRELWMISDACQETDECCQVYRVQDDGTLKGQDCEDDLGPMAAVCVRDHKGEGARLRVSSVEAVDSSSVTVFWKYEGKGWKTDELQVKIWQQQNGGNPSVMTFSTLNDHFSLEGLILLAEYSFVLRPAPNIRSDEKENGLVIVEFPGETPSHGAILTPLEISSYVVWNGIIQVSWAEARALSVSSPSPISRTSGKYSIRYEMEEATSDWTEVIVSEYRLTPISMAVTYAFTLRCGFLGVYYECAKTTLRTDPPSRVIRGGVSKYVAYQMMMDKRQWVDAEDQCVLRSGHLISLLNEKEDREVLKILPDEGDTVAWTGAKLSRGGNSYWTDGNKITYIPMAKNSGVTSAADSCCRTFNDRGRLQVSGGDCRDKLPFICKFLLEELLHPPFSVRVEDISWNSFTLLWDHPDSLWLPTYYNIFVCHTRSESCSLSFPEIKETSFYVTGVDQFTEYNVKVESTLKPLGITTYKNIPVFTYPKIPVQYNISSDGILSVNAKILISMGRQDATLAATLASLKDSSVTSRVSGPVPQVTLKGLVPGNEYSLDLEDTDFEATPWKYKTVLTAAPTCLAAEDLQVDSKCYRIGDKSEDFNSAKKTCQLQKLTFWKPRSKSELDKVKQALKEIGDREIWVEVSEVKLNLDEEAFESSSASNSSSKECCLFLYSKGLFRCSCDSKSGFSMCTYEVKADLGKVRNLVASSVSNNSITVAWMAPLKFWDVKLYQVRWSKSSSSEDGKETIVQQTELVLEDLEFGTDYAISVSPFGTDTMVGDRTQIIVGTADPNPPLTVTISEGGVVLLQSPRLSAKGRGEESVVVKLQEASADDNQQSVVEVRGQAKNVTLTGLVPGKKYNVQMVPSEEQEPDKDFKFNSTFTAYPTCPRGKVQEGLICIWTTEDQTTWSEAINVCRTQDGALLDPSSREQLSSLKSFLTSQANRTLWVDVSKTSSPPEEANSQCQDGSKPSGKGDEDALCCSYDVLPDGTAGNLKCSCCEEKKAFVCKTSIKIDLGQVSNLNLVEITQTSVTLTWDVLTRSWNSPSYLVTWRTNSGGSKRKRRSVSRVIVDQQKAKIDDLQSGTSYVVGITPFADDSASGDPSEITVLTKDDVLISGIQGSKCSMIIMKMVSCVLVICFVLFNIFIFLVTRMLYMDCLAHLCSEVAMIGAYLSILVSSAQSYSVDDECVRSRPTLCIATAVLIQFFFQVVFLFLLFEGMMICQMLKGFITWSLFKTPWSLLLIGWGLPAVIAIISAAITGDGFTDGNDNCWLDVQGKAFLPSVIPIFLWFLLHLLLILASLCNAQIPDSLSPFQQRRAKVFLKTRWVSLLLLVLTSISWSTGMMGAGKRDVGLNIAFAIFSILLGISIPILRIICEDQVKEQLGHGLFSGLRENSRVVSVTPGQAFSKGYAKSSYTYDLQSLTTPSSGNSDYSRLKKPTEPKNIAAFTRDEKDGVIWHR